MHELNKKHARRTIAQVGRFLGVGAVNTVFTFILYEALLLITSYRLAYTMSFVAGICFAAVAQSLVVFRVRLSMVSILRFVVLYLTSYVIGFLVLTLAIDIVGISPVLAPFLVVTIMLPINFLGGRLVFRG